jgi:uncharacterized membrane protein
VGGGRQLVCSFFSFWYFSSYQIPGKLQLMSELVIRREGLALWGRGAFALATVGFGVHHLVTGGFATRVLPGWPLAGSPAPWALLVGVFLVASGAALLLGARRPALGLAIAALWLLGLFVLEAPRIVARWTTGYLWTPAGKNLVLAAGALLWAASVGAATTMAAPGTTDRRRRAWTLARWVLGSFLVLCGVQHFVYAEFAAKLVPSWIPGPMFWTLACGVALIACGAGLAVPRTTWVAGLVAGGMIATWFLILHIPRAIGAWRDPGEWSGVCESLAIAGVAWLVAGSGAGEP